jgi:hypothetical protein
MVTSFLNAKEQFYYQFSRFAGSGKIPIPMPGYKAPAQVDAVLRYYKDSAINVATAAPLISRGEIRRHEVHDTDLNYPVISIQDFAPIVDSSKYLHSKRIFGGLKVKDAQQSIPHTIIQVVWVGNNRPVTVTRAYALSRVNTNHTRLLRVQELDEPGKFPVYCETFMEDVYYEYATPIPFIFRHRVSFASKVEAHNTSMQEWLYTNFDSTKEGCFIYNRADLINIDYIKGDYCGYTMEVTPDMEREDGVFEFQADFDVTVYIVLQDPVEYVRQLVALLNAGITDAISSETSTIVMGVNPVIAGQVIAAQEVDPIFSASTAFSITPQDIVRWNSRDAYRQQVTNETTIVVNHNLGMYPSVNMILNNGTTVEGAVTYDSINTLTVRFNNPVTGQLVCS